MTSHTGRLYSLAFALVVFFLAWAVVAARPKPVDPLAARERQLRQVARLTDQVIARRRAAAHAPAPSVRVVTLPPVTVTRSS
jgi:hypothetical protein